MSNREPKERRPRPRTPPPFVTVELRGDTYELLSRTQTYLAERRRVTVDLSDTIEELVAVSPFLLGVIGPLGSALA